MNNINLTKKRILANNNTTKANNKNVKIKPIINSLEESIKFDSQSSKHLAKKSKKEILQDINNSKSNYFISPVKGPKEYIYPVAPSELLEPNLLKNTNIDPKSAFIFYFESLYPLTKSSKKWRKMSLEKLQNYYDNLQFWYIFNTSWTSSPMPITLSDKVYKNWEKNTFYQANTIIQSAITSWGLAWRNNNSPQDGVKSSLTYISKSGKEKTINSVTVDREYWDVVCGNKMEVTSWGWNPYPFGIYAQGPFNGTGNFLDIPEQKIGGSIVGTSHWDIILKCKADNVKDSAVWTSIFNHEINDGNIILNGPNKSPTAFIYSEENFNVTPWIIIHDLRNDTWKWSFILGETSGGYTPFLLAYFLWYIGGFGGIGGVQPFDTTWENSGYRYTPIYVIKEDGELAFPEDQSVPDNVNLPGNWTRTNDEFWSNFSNFFKLIQAWDTDWNIEKWRHPVLKSGVGASVINTSDSLMMAYCTGNFDLVRWSVWNMRVPLKLGSELGEINPKLSKFSTNPAKWSHYQTKNGDVVKSSHSDYSEFPTGIMTDNGSGYVFAIRTQMPNVNFDICSEFADFRVCTPGNLVLGTGDQRLWSEFFTHYAENYMFTADPDNLNINHNFSKEYSIRLPDTNIKISDPKINNWLISKNVSSGTTFFNFDVKSGIWDSSPTLTGIDENNNSVLVPKNFGQVPSSIQSVNLWSTSKNKDKCIDYVEEKLNPPASNLLMDITGGAVSDPKFTKNFNDCAPGPEYSGYSVTNAPNNFKYFESPVDDFSKGIVGYQANGYSAQLGSCQTRWIISSKGIPLDFSAPLSNRLLLIRGADRLYKTTNEINKISETLNIILLCFIIISIILLFLYIFNKNKISQTKRYIILSSLVLSSIISIVIIILKIINHFKNNSDNELSEKVINDEGHRLRTYLTLVYPQVPISRWKQMSLDELRTFFCSLHWWYKGDGLPSPKDYLNTKYWTDTKPFGKNSSWKNFALRKNCILNVAIPAYNETDNKLVIGNNEIVNSDINDSPSAIIWSGRQLQSLGAQSQQTTFFHPSANYHIDTYNNFPTVNDTDLKSWEKAQYVEISSQWGPFPDGIYYDWAPGTGVWLSLEKHAVGYTGLDLIRRLGIEFMDKKLDLNPVYREAWQKTGLSNMTLTDKNTLIVNEIFWPDFYASFGFYGTVILTTNQNNMISKLAKSINSTWLYSDNIYNTADGDLYKQISKYVTPQYLVETSNEKWSWTNTKPNDPSYVENYPLPLPYFTEFTYDPENKGYPKINNKATKLPWKYQLFNICAMMRGFCIDLLFLDETLIDSSKLEGMEYVDLLKANKEKPLNKTRTWQEAIDKVNNILSTPYAHPLFLIYSRIMISGNSGDGPYFILSNEKDPTLNRIQTGALDKDKYIQSVDKNNNGVTYGSGFRYPQLSSANLEIDHWLPMLGQPLNYKSCVRIQHWCGNKSLSLDIEIINISQKISGNLISNMPTDSLYEVWKQGAQERLSVRDPFADDSHVYFEDGPVHLIRQKYHPNSSNEETAKWTPPPWIEYFPNVDMSTGSSNIYGWPAENLENFMTTNRLSYCPANTQQISLSGSYPEYNKIIFEHMVRNKTILNL